MTIRKLRDHAYAQCAVYIDDQDNATMVSYYTPVILVKRENGKRYVKCTGTYSATTSRHISWFLREYEPDLCYYDMKRIVNQDFAQM